jgi:hypothetical protein
MTPADQQQSPTSNAEAIEAWDGPLFERFVQYRHIVVAGLSGHGDEAMRLHPPQSGVAAPDGRARATARYVAARRTATRSPPRTGSARTKGFA